MGGITVSESEMPAEQPATTPAAMSLVVHGYVQGVGFRYFVRNAASRARLTGWVRNNYDGTVQIWAEGPRASLEAFIETVRRGPSRAEVTHLEITWGAPLGEARTFTVRF